MRFLSVLLLLVSCQSLLTLNALPIDGNDKFLVPQAESSIIQASDPLSEHLVQRGSATAKPAIKAVGVGKATTPKCSRAACIKCTQHKAKRDLGLVRRAPDSNSHEYWKAVGDLGAACDQLHISYVLLGGTASTAFGSPRTTQDIDMVAYSSHFPGREVEALMTALPNRLIQRMDQWGCAEYTMDGIEIDIFDPVMWQASRPQYMEVVKAPYTVKKLNYHIKVPPPRWLLKEKQQSYEERKNNMKGPSDKADIEYLENYIRQNNL